jgi:very-short-patch-repair endonuclease
MTEREYDVYLLLEGLSPGGFYHNLRLSPMGAIGDRVYYLLDFADPVRKLNIEVDGPEHQQEKSLEADKVRDEWLTSQGWTILRVTNEEVLSSIDSVKEKIRSLVMT